MCRSYGYARLHFATAAVVAAMAIQNSHAAVSWKGTSGTNWGTAANWSNNSGPATTDTASFTDTGSSNLPGDVTSVLNVARTIGGLSFNDTASHFHTLDLNNATLTVTGILSFNIDQNQASSAIIRDGTLDLSGSFANLSDGRGVSGASIGVADLSGLSAFNANAGSILVGVSSAGTAKGTLTLSPINTINTSLLQVGASNSSDETIGILHLGLNNNIVASEWDIGKDNSTGQVDIVNGGSLVLGSTNQRTVLQIANQTTNTNNTYSGSLNLGNAAVDLHLDSLVVAEKNGGPGGVVGQLVGGASGSISIGTASARGTITVADTVNGGGTQGTVDLRHLTTMTAYVTDFLIGTSASGSATGTVYLPASNTINASNSIVVGSGGSVAALTLGQNNTILTNQLTIGQDYTNGTMTAPTGATVSLGSAAQRSGLYIAVSNAATNNLYTGKLDLTGATFNAYLSQLTVGQRQTGGGGGTTAGLLIGPTGGSIDVGAPGNTANFIVGNAISGNTTGNVDFSGMTNLTASLNTLSIGVSQAGSSQGTVKLAANNNISVNSIILGSNGEGTSLLAFGNNNTVLANQISIAQDSSNAQVTISNGGTLNLGSPTLRTKLSIATASTISPYTYSGYFDMSGATLVAYLDSVTVGNRDALAGADYASFTISNRASNHVDANTITIGGTRSTGILTFGGGQLIAGSIAAGSGTPSFSWSGGQLSVGTFGSAAIPFNLNNTGNGTLAPGSTNSAIASSTIYGNYTQTSGAAMAIQIAGASPGAGNDVVNISGSASLAGTLNLSVINGFTPSVGQNFLLATYASDTGSFSFVSPPALPQNVAFQLDYTSNPTQLLLHMVAPSSQSWTSAASVGTFSVAGNWNTATTPGTSTTASITNTTAAAQQVNVATSTTVHRITLLGSTAPLDLEVPSGISLGVANQIVVGTNSTLSGAGQILGNVILGGGVVSPGPLTSTLQVVGDLNSQAGSTLAIDLAGVASGQHDIIDITGAANLAGALRVSATNGFVPLPGESFDVIHYTSHTGDVTIDNATGFAGLIFNKTYSASALTLTTSALGGDANLDGVVNALDFNIVATNFGSAAGRIWTQGDFNHDSATNTLDFVTLASNFNQRLPGATSLPASVVPEPATIGIFALGASFFGTRCRRAARRSSGRSDAR